MNVLKFKFHVIMNIGFNIINDAINVHTKEQITGVFISIIGFSGSGKLSTAIGLSNIIDALIVNSNFSNNTQIGSIYDSIFEDDQIRKGVQVEYITSHKLGFRQWKPIQFIEKLHIYR